MQNKNYVPRITDKKLSHYLETFGAVCIEGPKWSGKTWSARKHASSAFYVGDPAGDYTNREIAEMDADLALEGEKPHLIDEWQEVPKLWDAVRFHVDQEGTPGQYILTGSSTPPYKGILHSGAGRIAKMRMHTMSLQELGQSTGAVSLEKLCHGELRPVVAEATPLRHLAQRLVVGGWPATLHMAKGAKEDIARAYLEAIMEDVKRTDGAKRNKDRMWMLLRSLARNVSTTATLETLRKDVNGYEQWDMDAATVKSYLDLFERLFLLEDLRPFSRSLRAAIRVKQGIKRHFSDPSLACALLDATPDKLIRDTRTLGLLFESLCVHDLRIYAESFGAQIYHYQDYKGHEFDAVIQLRDGAWCAFEIKLGANQVDAGAESLRKTAAYIGEGAPAVLCVICGTGAGAYRRKDGVFVAPLTMLGP